MSKIKVRAGVDRGEKYISPTPNDLVKCLKLSRSLDGY